MGKGRILKSLLSEWQLGTLPNLVEPNQEIPMDFVGPITFKNNTQNN